MLRFAVDKGSESALRVQGRVSNREPCPHEKQRTIGLQHHVLEVPTLSNVSVLQTSSYSISAYHMDNPTGDLGGQCQSLRETPLFRILTLHMPRTLGVLSSPKQQLGKDSLGLPTLPTIRIRGQQTSSGLQPELWNMSGEVFNPGTCLATPNAI